MSQLFGLLALLGLFGSGWLLARRWLSGAEALTLGLVIGWWEAVFIFLAEGYLGFLGRFGILAGCLAFVALNLAFAPRELPKARLTREMAWALLLAPAGAYLAVEAWLLPPRGWDSLTYHVGRVLWWLTEGTILAPPQKLLALNGGFGYPPASEALWGIYHGAAWSQLGSGLVSWVLWVLLLAPLGVLTERWGLAWALVAGSPLLLAHSVLSYADLPLLLSALSCWGLTLAYWREGGPTRAFGAFLAGSLASGVKLSGGLVLLASGVVLLPLIVRRKHLWTLVGLLPALVFAPWWPGILSLTSKVSYFYGQQYLFWPAGLLSFFFRDLGLGTYEGGFGLGAWCLGLPAVLYLVMKKPDWPRLWLLTQLPLWILAFALAPGHLHPNELRLAVPALGVLGVAVAWTGWRGAWLWISVGLSVLLGFGAVAQQVERRALFIYMRTKRPMLSYAYQFPQSSAWDRLDGEGEELYAEPASTLISPLFGTRLQNRVHLWEPGRPLYTERGGRGVIIP